MWKSVCCEVQGSGHKKNHVPCQDKTFELKKNDVYVIALADGAGSASMSHYGAERVVKDASEYMVSHFEECMNCANGREVKYSILTMLRNGLAAEAELHQCSIRDLASTLLLAAVNSSHFIIMHIGDGVIGYLDGDTLKVASTPYNGEFANVTTFVTSKEAPVSMRLFKGELKDKDAFVLMSDGTEQSLYHKRTKTLAEVITKLMHRTCLIDGDTMRVQMEDALENVISKQTNDDCSIAILARQSETLCPIDAMKFSERQQLYGVKGAGRGARKCVTRLDEILAITDTPRRMNDISKEINLKPKYARKHLDRLIALGLLTRRNRTYVRV